MSPDAVELEPVARTGGASDLSVGWPRFDWLMAGLGAWLVGGLYLDGWAHIHVPELESFFTPWHAVLYSGYLASAAALVATFSRNRRQGALRSKALPAGYRLSLVGVFIFFFAGVADMLWHIDFGVGDGGRCRIGDTYLACPLAGLLMSRR